MAPAATQRSTRCRTENKTLIIDTRDMGTVNVAPDQVVNFVSPLFGFESYRDFAIIPIPKALPFHWLQCLEEKCLAFPLVNAEDLQAVYTADLVLRSGALLRRVATAQLEKLGADSWDQVQCWVIVAVPPDGRPIRPNLAAPVVVNPKTRLAAQIIVQEPGAYRRL